MFILISLRRCSPPVVNKNRSAIENVAKGERAETRPQGLNRSKAYLTSFQESRRRVSTSKSSLHLNPSFWKCLLRKNGIRLALEFLLNEGWTPSFFKRMTNLVERFRSCLSFLPKLFFLIKSLLPSRKRNRLIIQFRINWISQILKKLNISLKLQYFKILICTCDKRIFNNDCF